MKIYEIKKTIEYRSIVKTLKILLAIYLILLLILISVFAWIFLPNEYQKFNLMILVLILVISFLFGPLIIVLAVKLGEIISIGKRMTILEVKLCNPIFGRYGIAHFQITIEQNEKSYQITSKEGIRGELLNKYNNSKTKIGFLSDYEYFYIIEEERKY